MHPLDNAVYSVERSVLTPLRSALIREYDQVA